jgi:hypothetical protein
MQFCYICDSDQPSSPHSSDTLWVCIRLQSQTTEVVSHKQRPITVAYEYSKDLQTQSSYTRIKQCDRGFSNDKTRMSITMLSVLDTGSNTMFQISSSFYDKKVLR